MASTIASSMQQLSMSFGLAAGSLVTAWFLGDVPQTDRAMVTRRCTTPSDAGGHDGLSSRVLAPAPEGRRKHQQGRQTPGGRKKRPLLHSKAHAGITHFRSGQAQEMGFPLARESYPAVLKGRLRQC